MGAIYCTICNNPRAKRFLREETILLAVIPGPNEPSLEQLNSILEIFVLEARQLYSGMYGSALMKRFMLTTVLGVPMRIPGKEVREPCHAYVNIVAADLPGSRKATGLRGHTSKRFMCAVCKKTFTSLVDHGCFDPRSAYIIFMVILRPLTRFVAYKYRDDGRYLKYAFKARYADDATREEIAERRGIRWSALNLLPDWLPARDSPPDFMHAAYLGMSYHGVRALFDHSRLLGEAKHVVQGILIGGGMFTKRKNTDRPLDRFKSFLESVWLPGTFNKVPTNVRVPHLMPAHTHSSS